MALAGHVLARHADKETAVSAKHHPVAAQLDALAPWLRVVLALERAGWDTHHSTSHHQRLAWACARVVEELERAAGVRFR